MSTLPINFETLPKDIREMLQGDEFAEKIELIGTKQSLPEMEQGFLVRICAKLVTGILPPAKFVSTISDELDIPREKAAFIAQEINRDIFSNIKESLKAIHSEKPDAPQTPPVAVAPISEVIPAARTPMVSTPTTGTTPGATVTPRATPMMMEPTPIPKEATTTQTPQRGAPIVPPPPMNTAPVSATTPKEPQVAPASGPQVGTTQPHIGSIFEQKLGGEFRLKSDAVTYTNQASTSGTMPPAAPRA